MFDACCCIGTGDAPEFCSKSHPVARKEHKCCECMRVVHKGEKYRKESGCWDGIFNTYKTCMNCATVRDDRMTCGFVFEHLWEDLAECYRYAGDDECTSLAWLHPMFEHTKEDCECPDCWPEGTETTTPDAGGE